MTNLEFFAGLVELLVAVGLMVTSIRMLKYFNEQNKYIREEFKKAEVIRFHAEKIEQDTKDFAKEMLQEINRAKELELKKPRTQVRFVRVPSQVMDDVLVDLDYPNDNEA